MATNNIIRFALSKSNLTTGEKESFYARIRRFKTIDQESLVDFMEGKNTTVTRQDIIVVLDLLAQVTQEQLSSGNAIQTDIFTAIPSIKGVFDSKEDEFSPGRHSVEVSMSASAILRKKVSFYAVPEKERIQKRVPEIDKFRDYRSDTYNDVVSAGYSGEIKGINLYELSDNPEQGVYFVNETTAEKTKVSQYTKQSATQIVFTIPENLSAGVYSILVKRAFGSEIREGKLPFTVTVPDTAAASAGTAA